MSRGTGEDKGSDSGTNSLPEPVRIIHKEQDSISAFCLNQVRFAFFLLYIFENIKGFVQCNLKFIWFGDKVNPGLMSMATPREVQEMDISLLLELPSWLEDECEFDIINLNKQPEQPEPTQPTSFLVIQVRNETKLMYFFPSNLNYHGKRNFKTNLRKQKIHSIFNKEINFRVNFITDSSR